MSGIFVPRMNDSPAASIARLRLAPRSKPSAAVRPRASPSRPSARPACARPSSSAPTSSPSSSTPARAPARPTGRDSSAAALVAAAGRRLRHRAQGRPAGAQPLRRRRHHRPAAGRRRPAGQRHREHRPDAERPAAARHHELDRRVLLAQPGERGHQGHAAESLGRRHAARRPDRLPQQPRARRRPRGRAPSSSTRNGRRSSSWAFEAYASGDYTLNGLAAELRRPRPDPAADGAARRPAAAGQQAARRAAQSLLPRRCHLARRRVPRQAPRARRRRRPSPPCKPPWRRTGCPASAPTSTAVPVRQRLLRPLRLTAAVQHHHRPARRPLRLLHLRRAALRPDGLRPARLPLEQVEAAVARQWHRSPSRPPRRHSCAST